MKTGLTLEIHQRPLIDSDLDECIKRLVLERISLSPCTV